MQAGSGFSTPGLLLLAMVLLSPARADLTETLKDLSANAAQGLSNAAHGAAEGVGKVAHNVRHVRDRHLSELSADAKATVTTGSAPPGWWGTLFSSTLFKPPPPASSAKAPPPAPLCQNSGVNFTIYCQDGSLYDPGAPQQFSTVPYSLPPTAYLAGRKPDKEGRCSSVHFGGQGTGELRSGLWAALHGVA